MDRQLGDSAGRRLVAWYRANGRRLPWRETSDPYAIWLAEIILQQTQVATGSAYYERFLQAFPTVHALAAAGEAEVMKLWEGLGYYSRARNLHKAARMVMESFGGCLPTSAAELRQLPGIGPYTANAIAAFAFGEAVAVLDGNVFRVLSRVTCDATPIDLSHSRRHYQARVDIWLGDNDPALFNHAIMDFGATLCTPKQPRCQSCPLSDECRAFQEGKVHQLPAKAKKMAKGEHFADYFIAGDAAGGVAMWQRGTDSGVWRGLWEPPNHSRKDFSQPPEAGTVIGTFRHTFSHYHLNVRVVQVAAAELGRLFPETEFTWVPVTQASRAGNSNSYTLPRAVYKMLDLRRAPGLGF